jgi:hypothetical protein
VNEKCESKVCWILHYLKAMIQIQELKNRIRVNALPNQQATIWKEIILSYCTVFMFFVPCIVIL